MRYATPKSIAKSLMVAFWVIFALPGLAQQTFPAWTFSPLVGERIDVEEFNRFRFRALLETSVRLGDIDYAEFQRRSGGQYAFIVHLKETAPLLALLKEGQLTAFRTETFNPAAKRMGHKWEQIQTDLAAGDHPTIRVDLEGGMFLAGEVLGMQDDSLRVRSQIGIFQFSPEDIFLLEVEGLDYQSSGQYGYANTNATRHLFAPTAIPLRKGEGYYQNVWIGLNSFNYGLSDHIAITGGVEVFTTFASLLNSYYSGALMFANLKVGTQVKPGIYLGAGALAGGLLGEDGEGANLAIGYGLATLGNPEHNMTLGVGWGAIGGDPAPAPIIMIGGMTRVSRRLSLVTENWIVTDAHNDVQYPQGEYDYNTGQYILGPPSYVRYSNTYMAFTAAVRLMRERATFDFGLVAAGQTERSQHTGGVAPHYMRNGTDFIPVPLPYLDMVFKF
ncbi:MAG: hypothetical protein D6722_04450 [Bacteroidetes bacterium]|nr:MAG: hypothetical protein D6722_04450 [Bacteroidota bacterium]